MSRCTSILGLSVLLTLSSVATADSTNTPLVVQQHSKADNLLLSEIPKIVGEWTLWCTKDAGQHPTTHMCWIDAASALTRYTKGFSESLTKQVEQLQANWLERAAQLQDHAQINSAGEIISKPADTGTVQKPVLLRDVIPKVPRPSATTKQVTQSNTKSTSTLVAKRSPSKKLARTFRLIQSQEHQREALKVVNKTKTNIVPAAEQRPIEASNYPSRKTISGKHGIRDELLKIQKRR
jgi:hypothetical protein